MIKNILFIISITIINFILAPREASAQMCGVFHKKIHDVCVKFDVPSNSHLTYSGNSWDCNRGFRLSEDKTSCEEIKIPDNASANTIEGFYCNSGFQRIGNECKKVSEIENGKFYEIGSDFYCQNGYRKNESQNTCEKIKIPQNAFADSTSFDGFRCFSGYLKEGSECIKFDLPEHGFWFHDYWGCEPGYKKNFNQKMCDKISIPENGHAANTFDGWLCNPGFTKNYAENSCSKSK